MKILTWVTLIILIINYSNAQENKRFFMEEFTFSINHSYSNDNSDFEWNNFKKKIGFGVGVYHIFRKEKKVNMVLGVEYNSNNKFRKYACIDRLISGKNVTNNMNYLSLPLFFRIPYRKKNLFIQSGAFLDLFVSATISGTAEQYYYAGTLIKEHEINKKDTKLSSNYGFSIGIGKKIPQKRYELIINSEFKIGLNELNISGICNLYNSYFKVLFGVFL